MVPSDAHQAEEEEVEHSDSSPTGANVNADVIEEASSRDSVELSDDVHREALQQQKAMDIELERGHKAASDEPVAASFEGSEQQDTLGQLVSSQEIKPRAWRRISASVALQPVFSEFQVQAKVKDALTADTSHVVTTLNDEARPVYSCGLLL